MWLGILQDTAKLIESAANNMARITCGDKSSKKLQKMPLSNDIIHLRINDMSFDIKNHLISAMKLLVSLEFNWMKRQT